MSVGFLDRPWMISVALTLLLTISGCHGDSSASGGLSGLPGGSSEMRVPPRVELLTLDEALGGDGVLSPLPGLDESTTCGPDWGYIFPPTEGEATPDTVQFDQGDRWIALGVWDNHDGRNTSRFQGIVDRLPTEMCRLGRNSSEAASESSIDWRVYPVDMGKGLVAFQAVEWSLTTGDVPPSTPVPREDLQVRSTARVYGIVNGKLVMARISHYKAEAPLPEDLKVLWDAQVAKVRYYDSIKRTKEVLGPQSASTDALQSQ
ncbi:MAG: hypothetical protein Q4C87_07035 [Actinomycetaceae bacterium]|nr:hypothetical protein [Actinomycetaceae bacterium]